MIYNIESLLEAENDGLKGAVKARDEHIDSFVRLCSFWLQARTFFTPFPWWKFWKNPDPAMLEFPLRPSRAFLNLPKIARSLNAPHSKNIHPAKLNFADNSLISVSWLLLNYAVLPSVRSIQVVGDSCTTCRRLVIESSTTPPLSVTRRPALESDRRFGVF